MSRHNVEFIDDDVPDWDDEDVWVSAEDWARLNDD